MHPSLLIYALNAPWRALALFTASHSIQVNPEANYKKLFCIKWCCIYVAHVCACVCLWFCLFVFICVCVCLKNLERAEDRHEKTDLGDFGGRENGRKRMRSTFFLTTTSISLCRFMSYNSICLYQTTWGLTISPLKVFLA